MNPTGKQAKLIFNFPVTDKKKHLKNGVIQRLLSLYYYIIIIIFIFLHLLITNE